MGIIFCKNVQYFSTVSSGLSGKPYGWKVKTQSSFGPLLSQEEFCYIRSMTNDNVKFVLSILSF